MQDRRRNPTGADETAEKTAEKMADEIERMMKRTPPELIERMDRRLKELRRTPPDPGGLMHRRAG